MWNYIKNKEKYGSEIAAILFDTFIDMWSSTPSKNAQKFSAYNINNLHLRNK